MSAPRQLNSGEQDSYQQTEEAYRTFGTRKIAQLCVRVVDTPPMKEVECEQQPVNALSRFVAKVKGNKNKKKKK